MHAVDAMAWEVSAAFVTQMAMSLRVALDAIHADLGAEGPWVQVTLACKLLFDVLRFDHESSDIVPGEFLLLAIHVLERARLGDFTVALALPAQVVVSTPMSFRQKLKHAYGFDCHAAATRLEASLAECLDFLQQQNTLVLTPLTLQDFWLELLAMLENHLYILRGLLSTRARFAADSTPHTEGI